MKKYALILAMLMCLLVVLLLTSCNKEPQSPVENNTYSDNTTEGEIVMKFLEHDTIVYPYIDPVKEYLLAGAYADVSLFDYKHIKQAKDFTLYWTKSPVQTDNFYIEIATKEDYSDAQKIKLQDNETSYGFKFLLKNTTYYVRLTAEIGNTAEHICTHFTTTDLGPRFLDVGGLYQNCRDLGGYTVGEKNILYNMIIRGSSPDSSGTTRGNLLTKDGADFLNNIVGVKTQLDLRGTAETGGRTESAFDHATYVNIPLTAYDACFSGSQADYYKQVFQLLADESNYPVYVHCAGGADRTGTVAALLLALLGVEKEAIIQDYVLTTFSPVCAAQDPRSLKVILPVLNGLDHYSGNSLSEKCASYLSSIGVSRKEIFAIKAIMFGEDPDAYVHETDYGFKIPDYHYSTASNDHFTIILNEDIPVKHIQIDGIHAEFEQNETTLTVKKTFLASLTDGKHTVTIVFDELHKGTFVFCVNDYDITGDLQVSGTSVNGDYTYLDIISKTNIFDGINYHFHTRSDSLYPLAKPNIKINGKTITQINAQYDLTDYAWTSYPANRDARHRVAVGIWATGNVMRLLFNTEWLHTYIGEDDIEITICAGFEFTYGAKTYKVFSDITYLCENGTWRKV